MSQHQKLRDRTIPATAAVCAGFLFLSGVLSSQEANPEQKRLGILLDTSPEMGFLVPQVRKEVAVLNKSLISAGRVPIVLKEFAGASLSQGASLGSPASKNALFALEKMYDEEKVDGIYWITSLKGTQSDRGLFALEELLKERIASKEGATPLVIRNLWQDQVQAGNQWVRFPPDPEEDPLVDRTFDSEWYDIAKAGAGYIVRSWLVPSLAFKKQFGYPYRITNPYILREMSAGAGVALMDVSWSNQLQSQYSLHFIRKEEIWPNTVVGRHWMKGTTLTPFLDSESVEARSNSVYEDLCDRETIEEDLSQIEAEKLGVLFGFGYVKKDLARFKGISTRPTRDQRILYLGEMTKIVAEARTHAAANSDHEDRVYASEFLELLNTNPKFAEPDRYARRMAALVRGEGVDAIYFFTNGFSGGHDYGRFDVDIPLIAEAIRKAGVKLYVRVPFEVGVVPTELHQLAIASGGRVFQGRQGDSDWKVKLPAGKWPEAYVSESE